MKTDQNRNGHHEHGRGASAVVVDAGSAVRVVPPGRPARVHSNPTLVTLSIRWDAELAVGVPCTRVYAGQDRQEKDPHVG